MSFKGKFYGATSALEQDSFHMKDVKNVDESMSLLGEEPQAELRQLGQQISAFWSDNHDEKVLHDVGKLLRALEGAIVSRYEALPEKVRVTYDVGELKELLEASAELNSNYLWMWRFPALLITVIIASFCIPLATALEHVIVDHPILGGFPPAISAAAGCIGIQNTAIIVRALGVKLVKGNPIWTFLRYTCISMLLSLGAAITEAIVAWVVVSLFEAHHEDKHGPWTLGLFYRDVPIVIFIAMLITGTLAGVMGAGIPLLVHWMSGVINKHLDPAHWVGPIETIAQELSAAVLTFWIAEQMFKLLQ